MKGILELIGMKIILKVYVVLAIAVFITTHEFSYNCNCIANNKAINP